METNKEQALNDFLGSEEEKIPSINTDNKKVVIDEREGLIERVNSDRILVTKDGKQLLREQY